MAVSTARCVCRASTLAAMIVWETGWSYAVASNYDAPAAQAVAGALLAAAVTQPGSSSASAP